jgi:hypothetical protein
MSATSNETTKNEFSLLDDVILNENDLTEEAKARFTYHTDILNAFEKYRCRIRCSENLTPLARHKLFSLLSISYANGKQVLNYMAEKHERLSRNLPVVGPVVITGLPRTGTTLLYNLLACDAQCRAPLFTDIFIDPAPPVARSNFAEQERRVVKATPLLKMFTENMDGTKNGVESCHPFFPIEEDYFLLGHAAYAVFHLAIILTDQTEFGAHVSDEMKKDFVYDYHETFLRMLNSVDAPSSHWLLKAPAHLLYLDTLLRHYPNAAMIMTHRSLNEVLPSFYRMMSSIETVYSVEANSASVREALTAQYTQFFDKMVECLVKFRTEQSTKNIFDVNYDDLMEQPIETVRRIYDHFNLKWSDEFEMGMKTWLRDNPQGKQGRHSYSLDEFGLTQEDIETRYADYTNLFLQSSASDKTRCNQSSSANKTNETI